MLFNVLILMITELDFVSRSAPAESRPALLNLDYLMWRDDLVMSDPRAIIALTHFAPIQVVQRRYRRRPIDTSSSHSASSTPPPTSSLVDHSVWRGLTHHRFLTSNRFTSRDSVEHLCSLPCFSVTDQEVSATDWDSGFYSEKALLSPAGIAASAYSQITSSLTISRTRVVSASNNTTPLTQLKQPRSFSDRRS